MAEKLALLNCRRLPARLDVAQTAALLNFGEHDIRHLNGIGLLAALGKPAPNAPKYFAAAEIIALSQNREWLEKATKAISAHWRKKMRERMVPNFLNPTSLMGSNRGETLASPELHG